MASGRRGLCGILPAAARHHRLHRLIQRAHVGWRMNALAIRAVLGYLLRHWRELALILILISIWLHGHKTGAEKAEEKWQAVFQKQEAKAIRSALDAEKAAREQERLWVAAYDLAAQIEQENTDRVRTQADRIIAGLRAGRLSFQPARCPVSEAAADPARADQGAEGGQPGLAGEELVARLAVCDEVTHERSMAVSLMRADRAATP